MHTILPALSMENSRTFDQFKVCWKHGICFSLDYLFKNIEDLKISVPGNLSGLELMNRGFLCKKNYYLTIRLSNLI